MDKILNVLAPYMRSHDQSAFLRFCFRQSWCRIGNSRNAGYLSEKVIPVLARGKLFYGLFYARQEFCVQLWECTVQICRDQSLDSN
jgi:hypothetical protein